MGNALKIGVLGLLLTACVVTAQPTEQCVSFDTSNWQQDQQNMLLTGALQLIGNAGITPTSISEPTPGTICAEIPPNEDLSSIVTLGALQSWWNTFQQAQAAQQAAIEALLADQDAEASANVYCQQDINAVEAAIDTMYDGATTQAQILNRTKLALKVLARCMWAYRR